MIPEILFYYRVMPGYMVAHSHKIHDVIYKKIVAQHEPLYRKYCAALLAQKESDLLHKDKNIRYLNELVALKDNDLAQKKKTISCLNKTITLKEREIAHHKEKNAKPLQMTVRQNQESRKMCSRLLWRLKNCLKIISKSG